MNEITSNYIYLLHEREFIRTNENIYKVSTISKNSPKLDTVIDPVYMKKYLYMIVLPLKYKNMQRRKENILIIL